MKAVVTYVSPIDGAEQIEINGHNLQFGGPGDGYCYTHQSFDCLPNLTPAEWRAINGAELDGPQCASEPHPQR